MRLVDADALLVRMRFRKSCIGRPSDPVCLVEDAPTIDAAPVVHGHWTTHRTIEHDGEWYCSACGFEPMVFDNTPYCGNCGAKMDGDDNAE